MGPSRAKVPALQQREKALKVKLYLLKPSFTVYPRLTSNSHFCLSLPNPQITGVN